jgi:hypothetical protein
MTHLARLHTAPQYFTSIHTSAKRRWQQLEADPELAGPWHQLFKQVQSPRHVLSELLQNADDAEASTASARIVADEFIFEHDGIDFEESHFASLCKFGYSNKRNLHTIGFRGIGFKSTFSLGDEVRLLTPTLAVAFHKTRFTEPIWLRDADHPPVTQVRVRIKDEHRRRELSKNLEEWASSPLSLLFFHNISALAINDVSIRRSVVGQGPVPGSEWVTLSDDQGAPFLIIRSEDENFPEEAVEEIRQERMGADDLALPPCRLDIVLGQDVERRLFVVLPTGVETAVPFACNAPFVQDPARVKIKDPEISPTNRWLLQRAGRTAAETMRAWLARADIRLEERAEAYALSPDVDREESSLEGVCATLIEEAFAEAIEGTEFLLTQSGDLVGSHGCVAIPRQLHEIWNDEQLESLFGGDHHRVLAYHVNDRYRRTLSNWNLLESLDRNEFLDRLESQHLPRPAMWTQLLALWDFVAEDVCRYKSRHYYASDRKRVRIMPVQGKDVLYGANEIVRLGEKRLLNSQEDWAFLAEYLLVLNQNWPRFLAEQRRRSEDHSDDELSQRVESAYAVFEGVGLQEASEATKVVERVSEEFFAQEECSIEDCVRLTQIAAALGASASKTFQYVTQNDHRTQVADGILADPDGGLDLLIQEEWYERHALHRDYWKPSRSCDPEDWQQWVRSERSGLLLFVPIEGSTEQVWGRQQIRQHLRERGFEGEPNFHYVTDNFIIEDHDFDEAHWEHWRNLASDDPEIWGWLLNEIIGRPGFPWAKSLSARIAQIATTGNTRAITGDPLIPGWILRLRELPCLEDTRGQLHEPAELLRRTPETEALLDVEPFIKAELDTEKNRPLLIKLGVRDTPTGPGRILERLRALARATSPPAYEVEKWYSRLDQLLAKCGTDEALEIREAFASEALVLTEDGEWCTAREVFLNENVDVPGAATVHPAVRHFILWQRVGVADHATAELALQWLGELDSGAKLSADELRRVRALLPRYAVQVWDECRHWLNLEGEWAPTDELTHKLTMQALVPWSNLFTTTKRKTADLQRLPTELCDQVPFASLKSLASAIDERIEEGLYTLAAPTRKAWIEALGKAICRIKVDSAERTDQLRLAAVRLMRTRWQPARQLQSVPYIDDTPAGTARSIEVVWKDEVLYVADERVARSFKAIAHELARPFDRQDIADAIKACVERSREFIAEYMEEDFTLIPEEEVEHLQVQGESAEYDDDENLAVGTSESSDGAQETEPTAKEPTTAVNEAAPLADVDEVSPDDGIVDTADDEDPPIVRPQPKRPAKPPFVEVYAKSLGYRKDGQADRFFHDDGSWLQRSDGGLFPWQRYNATGQLVQSYWLREHCLEKEPLKLGADVWRLCQDNPQTYTLVLAGLDGRPVEFAGTRLIELTINGSLKLYPAEYRIAYEGDEAG